MLYPSCLHTTPRSKEVHIKVFAFQQLPLAHTYKHQSITQTYEDQRSEKDKNTLKMGALAAHQDENRGAESRAPHTSKYTFRR